MYNIDQHVILHDQPDQLSCTALTGFQIPWSRLLEAGVSGRSGCRIRPVASVDSLSRRESRETDTSSGLGGFGFEVPLQRLLLQGSLLVDDFPQLLVLLPQFLVADGVLRWGLEGEDGLFQHVLRESV